MLKSLTLNRVGPADTLHLDFDPRLNVLTGDNGLGKTFILDIAWWALTGSWAGTPVISDRSTARRTAGDPEIRWCLDDRVGRRRKFARQPMGSGPSQWLVEFGEASSGDLVLYARIDGGISIWEPIRLIPLPEGAPGAALHLSPREVWDGKPLDAPQKLCEGLIRDWRDWQQDRDPSAMKFLADLLALLSPDPSETIAPGSDPQRIAEDDVRKIPRIALPWGEVPVTLASAGVRRILSLAYALVWSFQRHHEASVLFGVPAAKRMVLLIDEVEAHLHPRWQRVIVPAILKAVERVQADMDVQVLMTTHSPMVLASLEPIFEEEKDQLFNFRVDHGAVKVDRLDWEKHGDATGWLQSAVFGLGEARSKPAEEAIERANEFLRAEGGTAAAAIVVQEALRKNIPGTDPFWATWNFGLRHKGIGGQP